jgi:hypothetical protein
MIISKAGMIALLSHFPDIDCTFGELQHFSLNGADVLAVQACAFNRRDDNLPLGRSFGELSTANADAFALTYPVSTIENRARNRAVIRHLGIEGVFSEEEIRSLPKFDKPVVNLPVTAVPNTPSTNGETHNDDTIKMSKIAEVVELCKQVGWTNEQRIRLYNKAGGWPLDTPASEVAKMLDVPTLDKAIAIARTQLEKKVMSGG